MEDQTLLELDEFKVSGTHLSQFVEKYEAFVSALSESEREKLQNFLTEKNELHSSSRTTGVTCDCPGQSQCSCSTWLSECCICWSSASHEGACGSYASICFCRTAPKELAPARFSDEEIFVKLNALNFREMFQFLINNNIDIKPLKQAFSELEKHALPLDN
ncbi:MAG: hypothetical protein KF845_03810 [Cyclobacteriaceae bacterium]|nr:hypothetical protein [Cyclobacteriaceae bacterium]